MPQAGDSFVITLNDAHLDWGEHRHTNTRDAIPGEGYIPIPKEHAVRFNIFNSNRAGGNPLYEFRTLNGDIMSGTLLAQGCSSAGNEYAKQFSGHGDLKLVGRWYASVNASPGGHVKITFTASNSLTLEYQP